MTSKFTIAYLADTKDLGCPGVACSTNVGERLLQRFGSLRGSIPVYRLEFGLD